MHRLIPQFILDQYQTGNDSGEFQAIGMLVDVSGFSAMTDGLAEHGPHGSEVLAHGMRAVFDPMINNVAAHGGIIVGFAGDAITAIFPIELPNTTEAHLNALAAAIRIQEYQKANSAFVTQYGEFTISFKIGLGLGDARWRIVASADGNRATYYFRGVAINRAVSALNLAHSGEIYLCPHLYHSLENQIKGEKVGDHIRFERYSGTLPNAKPVDISNQTQDLLGAFYLEEISSHEQLGEFRPAVNLFISIPQADASEIILEPLIQKAMQLQERYGGLLTRPDFGDKGLSILLFWGAPVAQENDIERALNFILDLLQESEIPIKAGVTYQLAYAGFMGGKFQEVYTCYGWGVNLSARMMMAAEPGEIWVDEAIAHQAERKFNLQPLGQQSFKGFSKSLSISKLLGRKEDERMVFSGTFVGRENELEALDKFIGPLWGGKFTGLMTILGDPGIGKSRLVHALQKSLSGNEVTWAYCQADEIIRQSLNPFRYWLKHYFLISDTKSSHENKLAFDKRIDELISAIPDEELARTLDRTRSFLGVLVELRWPDSLYEQLDAQGRYENTLIALSTLLRAESLRQPVIVLIEDIHLLDEDSRAFLPYLSRTLTAERRKSYPLALLATSREPVDWISPDDLPNQTIQLGELSQPDLTQLAEALLEGELSRTLLTTIERRSEGNPFFAEQVIRYLQEEQKLAQGRWGWYLIDANLEDALPTDVRVILISRLDRLKREVREVVQTASILGREFELRLLSNMLQGDEELPAKIRHATESGIWVALTEIRLIFRHAMVRDAAYNMQLRTRRQELHQVATEAFEALYHGQLTPHYSEIAYHAERAGLLEKARDYYRLAGDEATKAYQNRLAVESYTHALVLTSLDDIQERIELLLAREIVYSILGEHISQEQDLATLDLLAERQGNPRNRAMVALHQADFSFAIGNYQEAQAFAESAIDFANQVDAQEVAVKAFGTLPIAISRQGDNQKAVHVAKNGIQLAQKIGDQKNEGEILNQLGLIMLELRDATSARTQFEQSLLIAQETGSRRLEAQVTNNLGNISGTIEHDYIVARTQFEKTLEIVQEIGNRSGECFALGNLGWVASMQGDFERAKQYQEESLAIARETGNRYSEAYGLINLSAIASTLADYATAQNYAEQGLGISRKCNDRSTEAWAFTYLGHAYLGKPDFENARQAYREAIEIRHDLDQPILGMEALAMLAQVEFESGKQADAMAHAEKIMAYLETGGTLDGTEEPIRIYLTVYLILNKNRDPRSIRILENAHSLLQEQVARLKDETYKRMYVENVPWRRDVERRWKERK